MSYGDSLHLAIVHRIGRVAVGEASLVIIASSPHRQEAYEASRFLIEQVKKRAPIWKQEHYENGDSAWLQGHCLQNRSLDTVFATKEIHPCTAD